MTKLKALKKKANDVIQWIHWFMPVSRRTFYRQNAAMVVVLESHKEFQMINRQDIMMLAKQMVAKQAAKEQQTTTEPAKKKDMMYG